MISTIEKDLRRKDRNALEDALRAAGAKFKGKACSCPFHDDKHPSSSVYEAEDGVWRFKCQAASCGFGGDVFDVIERSGGKNVAEQLREMNRDIDDAPRPVRIFPTIDDIRDSVNKYTRVERVHTYTNPDTQRADLVIVRCRDGEGAKTFQQYKPTVGGFCIGAPPKPWPIYNRTRVKDAKEIVFVEGEKCVEALASIGVTATTTPCGAGKASSADLAMLAGKTIYLWPDNDPPDPKTGKSTGAQHMREVLSMLEKLRPSPRVLWIEPEILGLPPKGDAVDFIDLMEPDADKAEEIWSVVKAVARPTGASSEVFSRIEDTITGKYRAIDWPFPQTSNLAKALFPGTVTLLCGDPAFGKSFMILDAMRFWHEAGIKVALYELEDTRVDHMTRALAQMSNTSGIKDDAWIRENPERARKIAQEHQAALDSFGTVITSPGAKHPTIDDLIKWVGDKCADGCKIIAIDPITYAEFSDKPWQDDKRFMYGVSRIAMDYGASIIVVTHPRKQSVKSSTMDDMAGGAAYPRHAQTILWGKKLEAPETMTVSHPVGGLLELEVDRIVKIVKARNGKGGGSSVGFQFDHDSLRFAEQGLIKEEPKKKKTVKAPAVGYTGIQDPWA